MPRDSHAPPRPRRCLFAFLCTYLIGYLEWFLTWLSQPQGPILHSSGSSGVSSGVQAHSVWTKSCHEIFSNHFCLKNRLFSYLSWIFLDRSKVWCFRLSCDIPNCKFMQRLSRKKEIQKQYHPVAFPNTLRKRICTVKYKYKFVLCQLYIDEETVVLKRITSTSLVLSISNCKFIQKNW